ncbi:hypothetical protein FACS1894200_11500 [Spirochaetia bacterium]|nr:hypothetical protein FACS1894200_11500 [Spirochaetia bacterium]
MSSPLDDGLPPAYILLTRQDEIPIKTDTIKAIIAKAAVFFSDSSSDSSSFFLDGAVSENAESGTLANTAPEKDFWASIEAIRKEIYRFNETFPVFHGIVLESLPASESSQLGTRAAKMISLLGVSIVLPQFRALILLSGALDRELIEHRLCKSLNAQSLFSFKIDNAERAFALIKPCLSN